MRNAFASELTAVAAEDSRVFLLSGDIGNRLFNEYKQRFGERFMNCGVAEAGMMGVAAGMALCGLHPIVYTIAPFTTLRCYEQIKLDVCYHNLSVVIVGVGAGLAYASLGPTHHTFEDVAALRLFPNMAVVCPGDALEVRAALRAALRRGGPVYIRLGKKNEPRVHQAVPELTIGRGIILREGTDVCILATGVILPTALATADLLAGEGVAARVVSMHTVKPLDTTMLEDVFQIYKLVVSMEEHGLIGGLGGGVAEWLADHAPQRALLLRFGLPDEFFHLAGDQEYARLHYGLVPDVMAAGILKKLREVG